MACNKIVVIYQVQAFTRKEIRYERAEPRGQVLTKRTEADPNDRGVRYH